MTSFLICGSSVISIIIISVLLYNYLNGYYSCKHKWVILQDVTSESKLEQAKRTGLKSINSIDLLELAQKKYETIVQCSECGKLKRYVERV